MDDPFADDMSYWRTIGAPKGSVDISRTLFINQDQHLDPLAQALYGILWGAYPRDTLCGPNESYLAKMATTDVGESLSRRSRLGMRVKNISQVSIPLAVVGNRQWILFEAWDGTDQIERITTVLRHSYPSGSSNLTLKPAEERREFKFPAAPGHAWAYRMLHFDVYDQVVAVRYHSKHFLVCSS